MGIWPIFWIIDTVAAIPPHNPVKDGPASYFSQMTYNLTTKTTCPKIKHPVTPAKFKWCRYNRIYTKMRL